MDKKAFTCRATYSVDNTYDSDRFIKLRVKVCHDGQNANGSVISKGHFLLSPTLLFWQM